MSGSQWRRASQPGAGRLSRAPGGEEGRTDRRAEGRREGGEEQASSRICIAVHNCQCSSARNPCCVACLVLPAWRSEGTAPSAVETPPHAPFTRAMGSHSRVTLSPVRSWVGSRGERRESLRGSAHVLVHACVRLFGLDGSALSQSLHLETGGTASSGATPQAIHLPRKRVL